MTSITYTATLDVDRETAETLARLLREHRERLGTRKATRALGVFRQGVLVLRWFVDGTRLAQLARDNGVSVPTAYRYLHEGLAVLADHAPDLSTALERATAAGHTHLNLDGTVIRTDRVAAPGPNGADLWWSGKHKHHGGNVQVLSAPDGWPIWVSPVRPGREHDTTCARTHGLIDALNRLASTLGIPTLTDLGYENAGDGFRHPVKKPKGGELDDAADVQLGHPRRPMRSPSGPTPCSRSPSRPCAGSASTPAASPGSPEPPSSCSSWSTAALPERRSRTVTRRYREGFSVSTARRPHTSSVTCNFTMHTTQCFPCCW